MDLPSPSLPLLRGFLNGLLLQTHLLKEGLVGFPSDHLAKGTLVVADNADAIDGYIFYEPPARRIIQKVVDGDFLICPDDGCLHEGFARMEIFLAEEYFFPLEKVQNQLRIGLLK